MAQPVYPTTLPNPDMQGFTRKPAFQPTRNTDLEDGADLTIRTKTFVPLVWSFVYSDLSDDDKEDLMDFWEDDANCGAVVVNFTDPTNSTAYFVKFTAEPDCRLENSQQLRWRVEVNLRQAAGSWT